MRKSLLSAVCAVSLAAAATLPSGSQARGITVAVGSSFTTLDPYQATDLLSRTVAKSFYEGLYSFDKNLKPVPQLAESYEVSEDGLVYTFKLRDGVKFHDGTDFTAEAVKLNFERVLNPDNHLSRRSFFNFIGRIEVVDRLHVKFVLSRRTPGFLQRLANGSGQMICPNTIKTMDGRGIAFNPCGTGPYLLKDYNPSERLVVVKNPNYRVKGLPKLDSITWLPVAENASRAAMLRTKEAAFIQPMPVEQVKDIENDPELKLNVVPSIMMRYLSINNAHKPFDDVRVRKAISLAINREALCKVAFSGYARPATGVLPLPIPSAV
ncbi:MAG: ABC transporter substrate-binding protein, partial [Sutterella wadsworthensis]|nr:ABC transporter substrate-binding protein [Sutterella wadsworthensis]